MSEIAKRVKMIVVKDPTRGYYAPDLPAKFVNEDPDNPKYGVRIDGSATTIFEVGGRGTRSIPLPGGMLGGGHITVPVHRDVITYVNCPTTITYGISGGPDRVEETQ